METKHFLYLAPIRGITDRLFRDIYHHHFPYFNAAIAPFINPQRSINFNNKLLADVNPMGNGGLVTIPQLMYNTAEDFISLGKRLEDIGYTHINWNLGCPSPMVANKQRGSGLLPYTDRIIEMLEEIIPALRAEISLKVRLGFKTPHEIHDLLPRLDQFPLKEIIIHPRIGKQLYRGRADRQAFADCSEVSRHLLVYNGDINTAEDFRELANRFKGIDHWMIGRGALTNPLLPGEIKGHSFTAAERKELLSGFHDDLYNQLQIRLSGPGHLLNRMKQIWAYLIGSFSEEKHILKKIRKASTTRHYERAVAKLFQ
ncbi:MAG: tRNA-dihydrouridine synthase family protein [Desulfocapsaceae bacterium]|nr:tRNA-dihydrouridine synthase family protein [Desulfocapsaceae bacterium]